MSPALAHERVQITRVDQRILVFFAKTLLREIDLGLGRSTAVERPSPSNL